MRKQSNNKLVYVLGLGITGISCVNYCLKKGWQVVVMDSRDNPGNLQSFKKQFPQVQVVCGAFDENQLLNADLVIVSPGIDFNHPALNRAKTANIEVVGDVELFARECKTPLIAITGSNGKSTVCDCMGYILNAMGIKNIVAGNIGTPVLDLLQGEQPEVFVLELSSFQIEALFSLNASVATVLNVSPDHLDRHKTVENYAQIKRRIYSMSQCAVINLDDNLSYAASNITNSISFGVSDNANVVVRNEQDGFVIYEQNKRLLGETETALKGSHNGLNFAACIAILKAFGLEVTDAAIELIKNYTGLAHRCQRVETHDDIIWINDSKATNVGAAQAAIRGFSTTQKALYLIAGGDAKGGDIASLKPVIDATVTHTWVFGKDAALFTSVLSEDCCTQVVDLPKAVLEAKRVAKKDDVVLFSPACASLDMYPNYQARGEHFEALVREAV